MLGQSEHPSSQELCLQLWLIAMPEGEEEQANSDIASARSPRLIAVQDFLGQRLPPYLTVLEGLFLHQSDQSSSEVRDF